MKHQPRSLPILAMVVLFGANAVGQSPLLKDTDLFADLWTTGIAGNGRASVDGVMHWQEWQNAAAVPFVVNLPGGGFALATLYVMNDQKDLYFGLKFERSVLDPRSGVSIELDANNSGVVDVGDDTVLFNPDPFVGFRDGVRALCPVGVCAPYDTSLGGTNDGAGAMSNDGTYTMYELTHPLDSGDPHDIALHRHETVGFMLSLRLLNQNVIADTDLVRSSPGFLARIGVR